MHSGLGASRVILYRGGQQRFETTKVGATLTGELTLNSLNIPPSAGNLGLATAPHFRALNTDFATQQTDIIPGGIELTKQVDYKDDGTTPNAGPYIDFRRAGVDDAGADYDARIQMDATGGGTGTQDGEIVFFTPDGTGPLPRNGAIDNGNGVVSEAFRVQRGGAAVTGELQVSGDIIAFYSSSDKNLKDNITPIEDPLAKVLSISGNTFTWKEGNSYQGEDTGVVAQEIEALGLPGIVKDQDSGHKSVQYHKLVPLLIEAIKELSTKVENLEQKLQDK